MSHAQRILVPSDFSESSAAALDYACRLAEKFAAQLFLLHVTPRAPNTPAEEGRQARLGREKLNALLSAKEELALRTDKAVISGIPHRVITDFADQHHVDLIVMGTHGRSGLKHLALGSVAARVLRTAPCPVLVVRPEGLTRSVLVTHALDELTSEFGTGVDGERDGSLQRMQELLSAKLDLSNTAADRLVKQLEQQDWIRWEPASDASSGRWAIVGINVLEHAPSHTSDFADSPALDLIDRARKLRATDIHIDPQLTGESSVRLRIDGRLEPYCELDQDVADHLINRFKMLSRLDIAEPFRPKEGRLALPPSMSELEVRITTAPVAGGEAVSLRMFARDRVFFPLDRLGFSTQSLDAVDAMLRLGEGLVLVTGPTGGGKTTTVYSMLRSLPGIELNIVSIEDPVEFSAPFVRQLSVDTRHGITMENGLRTILRMDPDVVFVGEIRAAGSAEIAMRAASSGRYVMSSLHTRDVASTVTALRDLGIPDRSIAGNLTGVVNQRLVRRLCRECCRQIEISETHRESFDAFRITVPQQLFAPVGCEACRDSGYAGRIGLFEAALFTDEIKSAIVDGGSEGEIAQLLRNSGMIPLEADALVKVADGVTDFDEALSVHWML